MDEELQQAQEVYNLIVQFLVTYSFQIVGAIIILILGIVVANKLSGFIENFMVRKKTGCDPEPSCGGCDQNTYYCLYRHHSAWQGWNKCYSFRCCYRRLGFGCWIGITGTIVELCRWCQHYYHPAICRWRHYFCTGCYRCGQGSKTCLYHSDQ